MDIAMRNSVRTAEIRTAYFPNPNPIRHGFALYKTDLLLVVINRGAQPPIIVHTWATSEWNSSTPAVYTK
jgi:hypothetical protein